MPRSMRSVSLLLAIALAAGCGGGDRLDGRYVANEEASLTLTLSESSSGQISGALGGPAGSVPIVARRQGDAFAGTVGERDESLPFTGTIEDAGLTLVLGTPDETQSFHFHRVGDADSPAPAVASAAPAASPVVAAASRHVVINERALSGEELAQVEQAYQIRIPDADYWYDATLGAWGAKGGPTMGFLAPGLALGGPLQADASGSGTGIFVNGRELHPLDVMGLQRVTGPIVPGRYFITAEGLAGNEGGPPQWNLAALACASGGGSGGDNPTNTWQSSVTGASGFSDGHTGAVFLPNGGIVSTGD
jgi:hypothetical protein